VALQRSASGGGEVNSQLEFGQMLLPAALRTTTPSEAMCLHVPAEDLVDELYGHCGVSTANEQAGRSNTEVGKLFVVDCRPLSHIRGGTLPTSYHIDPTILREPSVLAERLAPLEAVRGGTSGAAGSADAPPLRIRILGTGGVGITPGQIRDAHAMDKNAVDLVALALHKAGFPNVAAVSGGYSACHQKLRREGTAALLLIGHEQKHCRACQQVGLQKLKLNDPAAYARVVAAINQQRGEAGATTESTSSSAFSFSAAMSTAAAAAASASTASLSSSSFSSSLAAFGWGGRTSTSVPPPPTPVASTSTSRRATCSGNKGGGDRERVLQRGPRPAASPGQLAQPQHQPHQQPQQAAAAPSEAGVFSIDDDEEEQAF
jgi:hypothetical protein